MTTFAISREPQDPIGVLRASIGGTPVVGFYLVFRGDPADVLKMLEAVTEEARRVFETGDFADERGQPQG